MNDFHRRIQKLSLEKQALLYEKIKERKGSVSPELIPPQKRSAPYFPLSFAQQRLWFLDQLVSGNPAYTISVAVYLTGHLHIATLERSFNEIISRHEILRTSFTVVDGNPVQIIHPSRSLALGISDLRHLSQDDCEITIHQLAKESTLFLYNLAQDPLLRVTLLRSGKEEHVLLLPMHHIISDEWSMGVLIRELTTLYEASVSGKSAELPGLLIQYVD